MRIKNRLSPYPILDDYGDDYINSSFSVEYEVETRFTQVFGRVVFHLQNRKIESLIGAKQAEYLVHIECPATSYRRKISKAEPEITFEIDAKDLARTIEIRTFIVLTQDINGFTSESFHPDYSGQKFDLLKHQILAIGTAKDYDIDQDDRDLESLPSVLQIVRSSGRRKGSISVNTDNDDHVLIGLASEVYDRYAQLGKNTFKATAFGLVLLPAMIVILQRMTANRDDADMNSRHWFQVIRKILERNGYKLEEISAENDSLLSVCQSVFADPVARSFRELDLYSERM